jgi:hypothetical protein
MRQSVKLIPLEDRRVLVIINDHTEIDESIRKVERASKKATDYLGVIDRYVYTVTIDRFGYINDASSAFCRFNEATKKELVGKNWLNSIFYKVYNINSINEFKRQRSLYI